MTVVTQFFSLPAEIRNEIYSLIWTQSVPPKFQQSSSLAEALLLEHVVREKPKEEDSLAPLLVCRQMREEAELLALSRTSFHLFGESALPEVFSKQISQLSSVQVMAIRSLSLTARVSHLHALNEAWEGKPFGDSRLRLDKLLVIPQKPDTSGSYYAEVADLSQCHKLAYTLAEALKSLKHVRLFEVRNGGCFKDFVWRLLYRCLVYRMWRWGGIRCGLKFISSDIRMDGSGDEWFRVFIGDDQEDGNEVGLEVCRLMGKDGMDPEN